MKYAIIQKVPFKLPGNKAQVVYGHVLCEREGYVLVLVPKLHESRTHYLFIAELNSTDHVFESIGDFRFDLDTDNIGEVGDKMKILGKEFFYADFANEMRRRRHNDEF